MPLNFKAFLTDSDISFLEKINTPEKVQNFLDTQLNYNWAREDRSVAEVIKDREAECYNGALLAAAALLLAGYKASILRLLARGGDEEHILCVYSQNGYFGSVAQSKFLGLKSRQPIYRTVRDLAVSYVEFYFGFDGRYTLQAFSNLLTLKKYNLRWLNNSAIVIQMAKDLNKSKHFDLVKLDDPYYEVSPERYWSEILVIPQGTSIPAKYANLRPKTKETKTF